MSSFTLSISCLKVCFIIQLELEHLYVVLITTIQDLSVEDLHFFLVLALLYARLLFCTY